MTTTTTSAAPISRAPLNITFLIALALFILPFVNIRCVYFQKSITGFQLITGFEKSNEMSGLDDTPSTASESKNSRTNPNVFAIVAVVAAIAGLAMSFSSSRKAGQWCLAAGIAGVAALIGLFIDIKSSLSKVDLGEVSNEMDTKIEITADFTEWYYICVGVFALAAYFSWKYMKAVEKALQLQGSPPAPTEPIIRENPDTGAERPDQTA